MDKVVITFLLLVFVSCSSNSTKKSADSVNAKKPSDTSSGKVSSGTVLPESDSSEQVDDFQTQAEEKQDLVKQYDKVQTLDSLIVSQNDTVKFHLKFYCLKDSNLVVPKKYDWDAKNPKEFRTHPFAASILMVHNKDTVLNRQFGAAYFDPFFTDNFGGSLKKYGCINMPTYYQKNKYRGSIALIFNIGIPSTDLATELVVVINKNGNYEVVDN